ncbi:MAG: tetraacyldisaccharide 4'-kinase [Acidobacteria bacterium]|nr:tetraacyldisaccharide 4'-kinase [Acidobacteriota bacterium]
MRVFTGVYSAVTTARNSLFDTGFLEAKRLARPVISIGNISTGGSGKTPFVIHLGELLAARGYTFDVLSRGYRRSTRGVLEVSGSGTPEQYGDEPLLIKGKLHCPVFVGADRYAAGLLAEREAPAAQVHLLDDGFQHRKLHRDFDIVMLNPEDLDDRMLPLGRLREPISSLQRADAVIVDREFPFSKLPKGRFQIWQIERKVELPSFSNPAIAFCGVARPQRFFSALRNQGVELREEVIFRDHHRYTTHDVNRLLRIRQAMPNAQFVTTEKDAINLGPQFASLNPVIVPLRVTLLNPESAVDYMFQTLSARHRDA